MKLLGLDHIGIVVRDINETIARAGDTVDGRAQGERILAGDIDLQFLLFGETRLELIECDSKHKMAGAAILCFESQKAPPTTSPSHAGAIMEEVCDHEQRSAA